MRRSILKRALWVMLALGLLALAIGRFGADCPACDAANNLAPQIATFSIAVYIVVCATCWRRRLVAIGLAGGALFALLLMRAPTPLARDCAGAPLRVVELNAWQGNRTPEAAAAWIRGQQADVVFLVEAKGRSAAVPDLLKPDYPYRLSCLPTLPCSTFILSRLPPVARFPLGHGDVENRQGLSAAAMIVRHAGHDVPLVAVHLSRPWPVGRQQREVASLSAALSRFDPRFLVVGGDFNATGDTALVAGLARKFWLGEVTRGATWPSNAMRAGLPSLLALDHILVGSGWGVGGAGVGPVVGSDHRPTWARLCAAGAHR